MAKISPVSIKYMVYARFEAEGTVEKPDVIGALFGQTEGLLGNDLEMRELQKEGKIGRIEVALEISNGKTIGKIEVPSALDKTETTLIAAAIETIERIGPSDAKIEVEKIDDVRQNKRDYILDRAKKLLGAIDEAMPNSREITHNLKLNFREDRLKEYGEEKLPCGDISGGEIVIVEGRADVINLLRNGVYNVIAMNGSVLPESIKEISKDRETTLFVDGDRGGKLIAKNVIENARINYIAVAPDGKEVEELTGKEILVSLRKRITMQEFLKEYGDGRREDFRQREFRERRYEENAKRPYKEEYSERKQGNKIDFEKLSDDDKKKLKDILNEVENTKFAIVLNSALEQIKKISTTRNIGFSLDKTEDANTVVVDTLNKFVVGAAERAGIANIIAKNFMFSGETNVNLISL